MVILLIVTTLVLLGWSSLQASYSSTLKGTQARSAARDAISRMTREIRDMQPVTIGGSSIVNADGDEITFYSAFNSASAVTDPGTDGLGHVALVRYWYDFDPGAEPAEWCIYRQRDVNGDNSLTAADPTMLVARNIVNGLTLPGQSSPLSVFTYFESGSTSELSTPVSDVADIATIRIHVVADLNPEHTPKYFDLITTIKPRN